MRILVLLSLVVMSWGVNAAQEHSIVTVKDMRQLMQDASNQQVPILLLFTAEDCLYCDAVREYYLQPLIRSAKYADKLLIRQLYIDSFRYLRNANGEQVGGDQLALKFAVEVTPTLLFIDAKGRELTERIVGINSIDYFDQRLEQSIAAAQAAQP